MARVSGGLVATAGPGYGITPANFPHLRAALAAVIAGVRDAKLLIVGDSVQYGAFNLPGLGPALGLAVQLQELGIPAAPGLDIPILGGAATTDAQWTVGAGWSNAVGAVSWGGGAAAYNGANGAAANTLKFAPSQGYSYDSCDLYFYGGPGFGTVQANIDGGANTNVNEALGVNGHGKVTVPAVAAAANHVYQLGTVVGAVDIVGIEPFLSTTKRVRVGNAGVNGSSAPSWASNPGAGLGPLDAIKAYAPDLTIIGIPGANDANALVSAATALTAVQGIVAAAQVSGDVLLQTVIPSGVPALLPLEAAYQASMVGYGPAHSIGVADLAARWSAGYAFYNALGFYANTNHPTLAGESDIARMIGRILNDL